MGRGRVQIYYGEGRGKSTAALGNALKKADAGKDVIIIQFLKAKTEEPGEVLQRLEPEIKFFRFEKLTECFEQLSEEEKKEESVNMKNGLNFARKVLATSECSLLVLDEVLGLVDAQIITVEDLKNVIQAKTEGTDVILTGRKFPEGIAEIADEIYNIASEK
jgi:cob(I)alamin adenosyltransferase